MKDDFPSKPFKILQNHTKLLQIASKTPNPI
jgi:hypothetical protein